MNILKALQIGQNCFLPYRKNKTNLVADGKTEQIGVSG